MEMSAYERYNAFGGPEYTEFGTSEAAKEYAEKIQMIEILPDVNDQRTE